MWALTIAGGKGERLRPLTDSTCKPMVPVVDAPLLAHQAAWLRENGVTDIVFLTGYLADTVEDYFGDGSSFGFNAHYSPEDEPLGRGGAVKQGLGLVPEGETEVIVVNGDILTEQPLEPLLELRRSTDSTASMMLIPYVSEFGIVDIDAENVVKAFVEKGELPFWLNAGVYVFDRGIEELLPDVGDHETETFPDLAEQGKMRGYRSHARWISVDSFKDLREAEELVRTGMMPKPAV